MEYTIDAKNKKMGRLASEIAVLLMGKDKPGFRRNVVSSNTVTVENVDLLDIDPKKMDQKVYSSYSGYPGGLKQRSMVNVIEKKGHSEVLKNAVYGMLPSNKLRPLMMKNLRFK